MSFARSGLSAEERGGSLLGSHKAERIQPWPATGTLIVAEVVGTGVLALGGSFAQLGWGLGLGVLVSGFFLNIFTSQLLGYVGSEFPDVVTFGDACKRLLGPISGKLGYAILYIYVFFTMANYLIVLSDAVDSVVYKMHLCKPYRTVIACVLLLPSNQLRTLTALTSLSALSFATIVATIGFCLYAMLTAAKCPGVPTEPDFFGYNAAISAFLFAYCGQSIMLEMLSEMKEVKDFPKAVNLSFIVLFIVYLVVPAVMFSECGLKSPQNLLEVIEDGPIKVVVGLLMVVHLVVTYTIVQQVLTRAMCRFFVPTALKPGVAARAKWFTMSTSLMALAWIVANCIPLFHNIVSITGALLSTQVAFTIPAVLFIALWKQGILERSDPESQGAHQIMAIAAVFILLVSAYCTIVGTVSSVIVMIKDAKQTKYTPFSC